MLKKLSAALLAALMLFTLPCLPALAAEEPARAQVQASPIAAGFLHSAVITDDGTLWAVGDNTYGQLGVSLGEGEDAPAASSELVRVMDKVQAVYAGYLDSFAIAADGALYVWGWNEGGQLGTGDLENRTEPTVLLPNVVQVSAGRFHTAAVDADGTLWTWGWNTTGQLGIGSTTSLVSPKEALDNVRSVSVGIQHTMAVKNDNTLWAAGDNTYHQLCTDAPAGDGLSFFQVMEDVQEVSCTVFGTLVLKTDGTLWACGYNANGEMGDGTTRSVEAPVQVLENVVRVIAGETYAAAIDDKGTLWAWGSDDYDQYGAGQAAAPKQVAENVTAAALGGGHLLYLTEDGAVMAMGNNEKGQLGKAPETKLNGAVTLTDHAASAQRPAGSGGNAGVIVLIVVLVLAVLALFAWLILRTLRGKQGRSAAPAAEAAPAQETPQQFSDQELFSLAGEMAKKDAARAESLPQAKPAVLPAAQEGPELDLEAIDVELDGGDAGDPPVQHPEDVLDLDDLPDPTEGGDSE